MIFKFVLSHSVLGEKEISEPLGWLDTQFVLERSEYHSLIEYIDGKFTFYGNNGENDGGIDFIRQVEKLYGVDTYLGIVISLAPDNYIFEEIFVGQIDLSTINELDNNTLEAAIIRDDFWAKFFNNSTKPIDVMGTTDMNGNPITPISKIDLPLPSQIIRQYFKRDNNYNPDNKPLFFPWVGDIGVKSYLLFDNSYTLLDEINERFDYAIQVSDLNPTEYEKYFWAAEWAGTYQIKTKVLYQLIFNASTNITLKWWLAYGAPGNLTYVQIGATVTTAGVIDISNFGAPNELYTTITLRAGEGLYIYGELDTNGSRTLSYFADYDTDLGSPYFPVYTELEVTADTVYPDSVVDSVLIMDAARSLISKMTGVSNSVQSNALSGCLGLYALMKGLHVRGYSFIEKQFFMTWENFWKGANPLLAVGLGYIDGEDKIEIEKISDFYEDDISVYIDNVYGIAREYDSDKYAKTVQTGFNRWSVQSDLGMDDPQTKKTYRTRFSKLGKDIKILCEYYMASLGIERTRRKKPEPNKDDTLDEEVIAIRLKYEDGYIPELGTDFASTSNLLNPNERYNVRDTPAVIFKRWQKQLQMAFFQYVGDPFTFGEAEGNYEFSKTFESDDCEFPSLNITEKQNIVSTNEVDHLPLLYNFKTPLDFSDYDIIRKNRKKAIGVSQTEDNHTKFYIKKMEYDAVTGWSTVSAWPKTWMDLFFIEGEFPLKDCDTNVLPDSCYRITEDGDFRITESGDYRILDDC